MSDCRHGGRDVYERPGYLGAFDVEERGGKRYYAPRAHRMVVTAVDMSQHFGYDTSHLECIVVNGVKFTREEET